MYISTALQQTAKQIEKETAYNCNKNKNEVEYKITLKILKILLRRGIINDVEYAQIDALNMDSFSPHLKEVYT